MSICVKFFATLREQQGTAEVELAASGVASVRDVWALATSGRSLPANLLCARNQAFCKLDTPVTDGDEIAFFPPVSGG